MKGIDPEIREYIRRINSYSGVRTRWSCAGHAVKGAKPDVIHPGGKYYPPYVSLRFADLEKFEAFIGAMLEKVGKGVSLLIPREKECDVYGDPSIFKRYYRRWQTLIKQLERERKLIFGGVLEALEKARG